VIENVFSYTKSINIFTASIVSVEGKLVHSSRFDLVYVAIMVDGYATG
jgi:hypothetical protein